jgi:hypothetical protein
MHGAPIIARIVNTVCRIVWLLLRQGHINAVAICLCTTSHQNIRTSEGEMNTDDVSRNDAHAITEGDQTSESKL